MACMQRLIDLPIREEYKRTLAELCSTDENAAQCQQLCDASDEEILTTIDELERSLADWTKNGAPQEVADMAAQIDPNLPAVFEQSFNSPQAQSLADMKLTEDAIMGQAPEGMAPSQLSEIPEPMDMPIAPRGYARGGLATLGRFGDNEIVHAQKGEMVIPRAILNQPGAREGIRSLFDDADVNPSRYVVGSRKGSINPYTGRQEFFLPLAALAPMLGGMVGQAAIGGAIGAGVGTFLGSYLATGDLESSLFSGLTGGLMAGVTGGGFGFENKGLLGGLFKNQAGGAGISAEAVGAALDQPASLAASEVASAASTMPQGWGDWGSGFGSNAISLGGAGAVGGGADPLQAIGSASTDGWGAGLQSLAGGAGGAGSPPPAGSTGDSLLGGLGDWWGGLETPAKLGIGGGLLTLLAGWKEADDYSKELDDTEAYAQSLLNRRPTSTMIAGVGGVGDFLGGDTDAARTIRQPSYEQSEEYLRNLPSQISRSGYGTPVPDWRDWQSLTRNRTPVYSAANGGLIRDGSNAPHDTMLATLRDNEFVFTPEAVRGAGGGSVMLGAKRLNNLMNGLERRKA